MPIAPNTKMKQLQWDKLPQQQVSKTLWQEEEPSKEKEMIAKLSSDGIWLEMEEDFKAKQLVINLLGAIFLPGLHQVTCSMLITLSLLARQKRAELKSVLDPQTKKRVGQYPLYVRSVRGCLIQGRRDPYSTR
jgi:cytokinesis protein